MMIILTHPFNPDDAETCLNGNPQIGRLEVYFSHYFLRSSLARMEISMAKVGLFFGSTTGHTEEAAVLIRQELDQYEEGLAQTFNVVRDPVEKMREFPYLILGTSTWDDGELQEDWRSLWFELDRVNLSGKKIAIYGMGDQITYPDSFQDALASMADKIKARGAELVGYWPADGYEFYHSTALEDGKFVGLALDNENQPQLTPKRIKSWVQQIVREFDLHSYIN